MKSGTHLGHILLAEARDAARRARAAQAVEGWEDMLAPALVAILCAHAALEARMNEAGEQFGSWWTDRERLSVEPKWADLVERLSGSRPGKASPERQSVRRLNGVRNRLAHFRGVPQPGGGIAVMGPPDAERENRSRVRTYFDASRAEQAVADAEAAIAAIFPTATDS